ncbi:MAG: hypothetical protein ACJ71W_22180 [Terriglobales bacterium]
MPQDASQPARVPGEQVDWAGRPTGKQPSGLAAVSIGELYFFMWKLLAAAALFAIPFLIVFLILANRHL